MGQLTLDGREVDVVPEIRALTPLQRDLLRRLAAHGVIRTSEAGRLVHIHRMLAGAAHPCGLGARGGSWALKPDQWNGRLGCCAYAASDGNEAMKRLMRRGLVIRGPERGQWQPSP